MSPLARRRSAGRRHVLAAAALLLGAGPLGCQSFQAPGLLPLATPPADRIVPEPMRCGSLVERPVPPVPADGRIVGAADFHMHQFANLGFGGHFLWGESYDELGIAHALSACGVEGPCLDEREAAVCRDVYCAVNRDPALCRADCDRRRCATSPPHGHLGLTDPVGSVLSETAGHPVSGYPYFVGWPHWNTYTHQQVYHRWLRRAFDGGLKLIVMHAVSNEVLCRFLGTNTHACDDMTNVDLQIQAAYQLEHDIDYENDCQINHNGWYRIARSPAEARQIIASGAMAVVLGIEVDTLFGCYREGDCTKEQVIAKVQEYAQKGVRHLFPVHLFDNAFGGTAAANDFFNFGNAVVQHQLISVRDCKDEGYEFHYGDAPTAVNELLAKIGAKLGVNTDRYEDFPAQCNERGLSGLGKDVIRALIDAGMIIDVDHMSARTRADVFGIAEQCDDYPGLVSGHSGFTDLCMGTKKHEGQLTPGEVDALVNTLHGLMAPILHQGNLDHIRQYAPKSGRAVANDCGDSATAFAQAYLYAVDHKGSAVGVGFGSDLNGLAGMPAPRFGPFACAGDVAANRRPPVAVSYPIALYPGLGAPMEQSQAGYRKFDINVDGFAHVGMFPDFVAELRALGLTNQDLAPLFSSAEAYIEMWERVERFEQTEHARGGCLAKPASP